MKVALWVVTLLVWASLGIWTFRTDSLAMRYRISAEIADREGDQSWACRCYHRMHEAREHGFTKWTDALPGKPPVWLWVLAIVLTLSAASTL